MKRTTAVLLALCLLLTTAATRDVEAAWGKKSKNKKMSDKRTEKPEAMKQSQRFEWLPTMSYQGGRLQSDGFDSWKMGDLSVRLAKDCVIDDGGVEVAELTEGRQAVIMGPRVGDTVIAWRVRVLAPDYQSATSTQPGVKLLVSEANSAVGEIVEAPK